MDNRTVPPPKKPTADPLVVWVKDSLQQAVEGQCERGNHRFIEAEAPFMMVCRWCGINQDDYVPPPPPKTQDRASWPEVWSSVAETIASRSYDPRLQVGAIVVSADNTQLLSLGYNGNFRGGPNEHESSEPGRSGFIHAEANCLIKCDYNFPKKKHMYVTHSPCRTCSKLIINADISRVIYGEEYRDLSGLTLMRSVGIEVLSVEEAILMASSR